MLIYYRFEETVRLTLNQIRLGSVFVDHEYRIYLRELGVNFCYTTGFSYEKYVELLSSGHPVLTLREELISHF